MKKFAQSVSVVVFCLSTLLLPAQQYYVSPLPYSPYPFNSGTAILVNQDDIWSAPIPLGFDFYFFGQQHQQLVVGANGIISFDTTLAGQYCQWNITTGGSLPNSAIYTNSIMFPYHDVDPSLGGKIRHQVYGAPPNRKWVLSFDSVKIYDDVFLIGNCVNVPPFTGQLVLHEGTNIIDMYIKNKSACPAWNNGLAIMGIQNATGTDAYTVPGRNNAVWDATNEGWRFSADEYFLPDSFNRISGRVFLDQDKNCALNGSDYGLKNIPIVFENTQTGATSYIYSDLNGYFSKKVDTGTYVFYANHPPSSFLSTYCPAGGSYTVSFFQYNDSLDNQFIADTASQNCSALVPGMSVANKFGVWFWNVVACDTAKLTIRCSNQGIVTDTAKLLLTLNDSTTLLHSPVPYTVLGNNQYLFNFGVLSAGQDTSVTLMIFLGCDTLGKNFCYSLQSLSTFPVPCVANGNKKTLCFFVGTAYDPNAILVSSANKPQLGMVNYLETQPDDYFDYTILFQNTGTAPAKDVKLKIPVSSKVLPNTLLPTSGSAAYQWMMWNDTLIVDFYNIQLPDSGADYAGSIGYFDFRINQKPGNVVNDLIVHQAAIYFDYLPPVITNNAIVKLVDTAVVIGWPELSDINLLLYPNPASNTVELISNSPGIVTVSDITGRMVLRQTTANQRTTFPISDWNKGMYLVQWRTHNGTKTVRLVKE